MESSTRRVDHPAADWDTLRVGDPDPLPGRDPCCRAVAPEPQLRRSGDVTYENRVIGVLAAAQQRQDYGSTWGDALDAAVLAARAVAS